EVKQAERALKTVEDALAAIISDVKKLADELHAPAADAPEPDPTEAVLKKTMAEYDALVVRLAGHPIGRLVVLVDSWTAEGLKNRGLDDPGHAMAIKLL